MKSTTRLSLALITFSLSILYLATTVHAQDCAQFSGPPKAACEAAAGAPAPAMGDISHCAQFSGPPKAACEAAAGRQIHSPSQGLGQEEGMRRESSKVEDEYNKDLEETKKRQEEEKRKKLEKWKIAQHAKCMFDNGRRKLEGKVELPRCGEQGQVSC